MKYGYIKTALCSPVLKVGATKFNTERIKEHIGKAAAENAEIIAFGENCVTGYSLGSMRISDTLLQSAMQAVSDIAEYCKKIKSLVIVGFPARIDGKTENAAAVILGGEMQAIVVKNSGTMIVRSPEQTTVNTADPTLEKLPNAVFSLPAFDTKIGICFSEDFDSEEPKSASLAKNGAEIIINLAAGRATIGSFAARAEKIKVASERLICAYAYVSVGRGESDGKYVYCGDEIAVENGEIVAASEGGGGISYAEIDADAVKKARIASGRTYIDNPNIPAIELGKNEKDITRFVNPLPFVPLSSEFPRIFDIAGRGILSRMTAAGVKRVIFGLSGGLDSTMVLAVCERAFAESGRNPKDIIAVTMSGFGSSERTKNNAKDLIAAYGVTNIDISIASAVTDHLKAIGHDGRKDIVYENAQARERAQILLDLSNKYGALLLGTGDLSEIALGWSTYGGDQLAQYNPNSSITKTLIRAIMRNYCLTSKNAAAATIINDVLATPVSPELIPGQVTEDVLGPYEIHDFFLYNLIGRGFSAEKTIYLAGKAFPDMQKKTLIKHLQTFVKRFFTNQFKRNASCDGVGLSAFDLTEKIIGSEFNGESFIEEVKNLTADS